MVTALVGALHDWLADAGSPDAPALPPRLRDLVELAHAECSCRSTAGPSRLARGRAVVDYVASLTDAQAGALLDVLTGRSARLWTDAMAL